MDYSAALKTVLTLAGIALFITLLVLFENIVIPIFLVICGVTIVVMIVWVIYMGFKGDLPEI